MAAFGVSVSWICVLLILHKLPNEHVVAWQACYFILCVFAGLLFGKGHPDVFGAYLPFWIAALIGLIIGIVAIKDYPEQCGCYRDNNKDMTPEIANAMLAAEVEAKKTSVWRTGGCFSSRDYWLITIPIGGLLLGSVGMMAQTAPILGTFGPEMDKFGGFAGVFTMLMIFGVICVICSILFSPKNVKKVDDRRRAKVGKELDDALVGRK